ncbi:MAG: hypothetical protein ABW124_02580 [Candidatus Thiodiazotropha sp. 6PLUC9]
MGLPAGYIKGTSINCLSSLRDLKPVAARREPKQNGCSILKHQNAAEACFRPRPMGLYDPFRLCVALFRQAISMALKAHLDSERVVKPEGTIAIGAVKLFIICNGQSSAGMPCQ